MSELPIGWRALPLGEIAKLGSGGTPSSGHPDYYNGSIPWAVIGDLNDGLVSQTEKSVTQLGINNSSSKVVPAGTLLIAMYGSIGKLGITSQAMAMNQAIAFIFPKEDVVTREFLFYFLMSQREVLLQSGKGATQQNISQTVLKAWDVPVPPLNEQRRIVEVLEEQLSRLDSGFASLAHIERKAKLLRISTLEKLLVKEPQVALKAPMLKIGDFATVKGGKRLPKGTPWSEHPTGHPYIRATNIKRGNVAIEGLVHVPTDVVPKIARYVVQPGDVLITIAGTIGDVAVVPEVLAGANLTENAAKISVNRNVVDPDYLCFYLQAPSIEAEIDFLSRATTQSKLALYRIETILMPVPDLDVQECSLRKIRELEGAYRGIVALTGQMQKRAASLRNSLLNAAFTGQLSREVTNV